MLYFSTGFLLLLAVSYGWERVNVLILLALQAYRRDLPVVDFLTEVPCQTKVSDFEQEVLGNQNIARGQVAMNTLQTAENIHYVEDIATPANLLHLK